MSNFDFTSNDILEDYYEILKLDQTSSIDDIRKNYLKLAKKYHPDHNHGNIEMFQKVSKAYECLSKKESRKNYDLEYANIHEKNNIHNINYFKNEYNNFIKSEEMKKMSNEEQEAHYKKMITDQIKDKPLEMDELNDKIHNIKTEREMNDIEFQNDVLNNILKTEKLDINDIFEYMKVSDNKQIIDKPIMTYDLMPNYSNNYSLFDNSSTPLSGTNYSNYNFQEELKIDDTKHKSFDINKFNEWKKTKKEEKKLTNEDIDEYIKKRKTDLIEINHLVDENLKDFKKKTETQNFLKIKNELESSDFI
jgi:curved DNA-binding protein CbpA